MIPPDILGESCLQPVLIPALYRLVSVIDLKRHELVLVRVGGERAIVAKVMVLNLVRF